MVDVMADLQLLKQRIISRDFTVGVIGLGYVGLPLLLRFGEVGFPVIGFDIDLAKIKRLNDGESYITHVGSERVASLVNSRRFEATVDFDRLAEPGPVRAVCPAG